MTVFILVVFLTLAVSAFCSLLEATLYSTRVAVLEAAARGGEHVKAARRFLEMKEKVSVPTSGILILNTIANTAGAALAGMYAAQAFGTRWVPAFSIALTFAILFFSEILPKTVGAVHWRELWSSLVWPLALVVKLLYPLIRFTQRFAECFTVHAAEPAITEAEIQAMIHLGERTGQLSSRERKMLDAVFHFDKLLCRQVMVPRGEVVYLDAAWPMSRCIALAKSTGHTRFPLCRDSIDEVLGIVHVKDLVGVPGDAEIDLTAVMRPARHVPETTRISAVLTEMQTSHQHMAVVVDEHGSTSGIVTLENVIEEIVGSVQDEFDREAPDLVATGPGQYVVLGSASVERINRHLSLELRAPGVNTMSGLLISEIGRFPEVGDQVELEGVTAQVLGVKGSRATRIRLTLRPRQHPEEREGAERA